MKIVCKKTKLLQAFVMTFCLLGGGLATHIVFAADMPVNAMPPNALPTMPAPPALDLPAPARAMPASNENSMTAVATPENAFPIPAKPTKSVESMDVKVPDSVKDIVKKLSATENITLEDLNSARQAVAKIDALIEIEKKIGELEKLHTDHENANIKPLASAIPASAINALPIAQLPGPMRSNEFKPQVVGEMSGSRPEISRIIGTGGRYAAVVKTGEQTNIIKVGDHFDGGTVLSISSTGLQVEQNKTTRTVHVKNVDNVFGDSH